MALVMINTAFARDTYEVANQLREKFPKLATLTTPLPAVGAERVQPNRKSRTSPPGGARSCYCLLGSVHMSTSSRKRTGSSVYAMSLWYVTSLGAYVGAGSPRVSRDGYLIVN